MGIDWQAIEDAGGIGKGMPRALVKGQQRREADAALRRAYAEVDTRDGIFSRVSGRPTTPGAVDPRMRREHHHLRPRSTHPELVADARNIFICTAEEHQLIHSGAIEVEGTNAHGRLVFRWADHIPATLRTFTILSKRKSQRRAQERD